MSSKTAWTLLACSLVACGDDATGTGGGGGSATQGCIEEPWGCPDGQTCWVNADQSDFACLNSGPGKLGDDCQNVAGTPTCEDDLACLQLQGQAMGKCTEYCDPQDPARACPDNRQCELIQIIGKQFHACDPPSGAGAGGSGGGNG